VSKTIVINVTASMQGPVGIDLRGAKIFSQITDGSPVIEIIVGPGVNLNGLTLSNFLIEGTGQEGDGIKIVADGSDRSVQNSTFSNLELEGLGGIGLDVLGNVSHGTVFDSWMNANAQGGARFANSAHGGVASGLEWTGGGFRQNGGAGLILDNGTHDMTVKGAYFVDNHGPGIDATSGLTLVQGSGFENNQGTGAIVQGSATFNGDTFSTYGPQTTGIGAYLAGGQVTVSGDLAEYYGAGSPTIPLADVQGLGTLAIAGNGPVVVGPNVTVTGVTAAAGPPTPSVTAKLVNDTGVSASDGITSNPALSGTADANSVVHFTVDGSAIAAIATANASGAWSFAPTGLTDGQHTLVASETNAAGKTGSASLSFTLDKTAPSVTEALASGGTTSSIPALTGKTDANAVVRCTVDGIFAGSTTANASGAWSYTPTGLADGQHTAVASVTDLAGNTTSSSFTFLLISTPTTPTVTAKLVNDTGVSANDGITSNPALSGTADANSVVHFTIDGSAIAATAATDANGAWSFTPIGLADGAHTIAASETNAAGGTGAASLAFTLDSHAPVPVVTGAVLANGQAIVTGTTGEANDTISLYDGGSLVGFTTTDSHGNWTVTAVADANVVHSYGANAIDLAGNEGHSNGGYVAGPPGGGGGAPPSLTEKLASDTGASSSDKITTNPGLTGTADANAVVHFTVDGSTIAATTTADASGAWSYTPTGLADGAHTVVASETNAGGSTGAASLAFTLDTHAPIPAFTGDVLTHGQVTLTGTTGEANDTISLYDGNTWIGFATTGSNGTWSFNASAPSSVVHSYGANATDLAGNEGHGAGKLILGSSGTDSLVGTAGNDVIAGNGGNDRITGGAGADRLTGGSGKVTFAYQAVKDSTSAASDTITDFRHGADKIDFGNIAGINATNGVPQFQGNITGSGNHTLAAHSVAYLEVGGNTQVLVNTSGAAEAVSSTDTHAANMNITLVGIHLGLTGTDFHHA
jgi:Ca2+-binding RTX toxin-like protein